MTTNDQMIPADKVRRVLDDPGLSAADVVEVIRELLPAPPRPTLADMTREERSACQWMQADVAGHSTRYVITNPCDEDDEAELIDPGGKIDWILPEYVTPRPDLPRLEWPSDTEPAPALPGDWRLADHKDHGLVIVTRPEPDRNGNVPFMLPDDDSPLRRTWHFCFPDELTYIDTGQEGDQ